MDGGDDDDGDDDDDVVDGVECGDDSDSDGEGDNGLSVTQSSRQAGRYGKGGRVDNVWPGPLVAMAVSGAA